MSAIVSPRPIWISSGRSMIGSMPRPQVAASKLTRVRVDGLSKSIPTRPPGMASRVIPLTDFEFGREIEDGLDPFPAEEIESQKMPGHRFLLAAYCAALARATIGASRSASAGTPAPPISSSS